jgi:hypothetical protein
MLSALVRALVRETRLGLAVYADRGFGSTKGDAALVRQRIRDLVVSR